MLRNYSNIIDQFKIRSLYIFFFYILWIFKRSDLILVVKDLISAYACTHACRERLIDKLAAFLPKPPNTGFGDVRCRIGAERLFIYFISFFLFSSFWFFFNFCCIFDLSLQLFNIFRTLSKNDTPLLFFSEGAFF